MSKFSVYLFVLSFFTLFVGSGCETTPEEGSSGTSGSPGDGDGDGFGTGGDGSTVSSGCPAGQIDCAGQCVDIMSNSAHCGACGTICAAGTSCQAGTCSCQDGLAACGAACVNTSQDNTHCGGCDQACSGTQSCDLGICSCPAGSLSCEGACVNDQVDANNCGTCGNTCTTGELCQAGACTCQNDRTDCQGVCSDLPSDPNNCGGCGIVCGADEFCSEGLCSDGCAETLTECGQSCVNTNTNSDHCGECGSACPAGQVCSEGSCGCPEGQTLCDGSCVDTTEDVNHCGTCGESCSGGQACEEGSCACPSGEELCDGSCTDTSSDLFNCGTCGETCPGGQVCDGGECGCETTGHTFCPALGACVNLQTNEAHCGMCGQACGDDQECVDGGCSGGEACSSPSSTTYQAESIDQSTGGDDGQGGWNIWSNGYVATLHSFESGTTSVTVVARGDEAGGEWPHLVLSVDGVEVGNAMVTSASYADYDFTFDSSAGSQELRVTFDNDFYDANTGADRNLYVDSITVEDCSDSGGGSGGTGGMGSGGMGSGGQSSGGSGGSGGSTGGTGGGSGGSDPGMCDPGTGDTAWATSCQSSPASCTAGSWTAASQGSDGHPLRYESEHFAIYWFTSDPDGSGPLEGVASPPSQSTVNNAFDTLEMIWDTYFGSPIYFPEPYCSSGSKTKAAVHIDDFYPLWGGGWGGGNMGLWVGPGALQDNWGLAHEFMHGVQSTTQAFPDCGGNGCWIFESHANWMPHQIFRDNVHCSEMLVNAPHLYYGNTRDRYCNWQFFEFLKDKHCYSAVNDMWAYNASNGQRDPWQKLMASQGWNIEQLNDLFGEWAMHNVTWDYQNPPPTNQNDQGAVYRSNYGSIGSDPGSYTQRRNRVTRLESLDSSWASNRRFVSPYYWAPQRWGYNVVRLYPEPGSDEVTIKFRGVTQNGANSGWRWGLVATNSNFTESRYSPLVDGADGELTFCINPNEPLFLVVTATPTQYQKLTWQQPSDGHPYPQIYRYPYMIEVAGAWPEGFQNGALAACPSGTSRHSNGGGCATGSTPASVYVGPYARVLGGNVSGTARIEDQATIVNGTVSGGTVGALSLIGVTGNPHHGTASFNVSGSATVQSTFYPMGWFGNQSASGSARLLGDLEVYSSKSSNTFYGLVDDGWSGVSSVNEVTIAPPYSWRP